MESPGLESSSDWIHSRYHDAPRFSSSRLVGEGVCLLCVFPLPIKALLLLLLVSFIDSTFPKQSPVLQGLTASPARDRQLLLH